MLTYNFKNKTVLITAGSKGIGFDLAYHFCKYGAKVAICSRNMKNLNNAKNYILSRNKNAKIMTIKHNLENLKKVNSVIKKIENEFSSSVDILVNNAGGPPVKKILNITDQDWNKALNNNLKSAIIFSQQVLKKMLKKKWGRIINLTSTTAKEPAENFALSNVTRSALASFSKTLSLEVAKYGITVNTILTGGCKTDRLESLIKKNSKINKTKYTEQLKKLSAIVPVGHLATTEEFIQLILFLSTTNSSYINGSAIPVDGGVSRSIF